MGPRPKSPKTAKITKNTIFRKKYKISTLINPKVMPQYDFPFTYLLYVSYITKVPKMKFVRCMVSGPGGPKNGKKQKNVKKRKFPNYHYKLLSAFVNTFFTMF